MTGKTQDACESKWRSLNQRLMSSLQLFADPVAISFRNAEQPAAAKPRNAAHPAPNESGRTGQVPAGCAFWIHGSHETFTTSAADHANCSIGSYTHGFLTLDETATKDDVHAVLDAGWIDDTAIKQLPVVTEKPSAVIYGPLANAEEMPAAVLLRVNAMGLMTLRDAVPDMRIEGKPQCHIIAIAKEQNLVAASVGCAVSRVRTGMRAEELTCVIPGARLAEVTTAIESAVRLNRAMANYAAVDAQRFE